MQNKHLFKMRKCRGVIFDFKMFIPWHCMEKLCYLNVKNVQNTHLFKMHKCRGAIFDYTIFIPEYFVQISII